MEAICMLFLPLSLVKCFLSSLYVLAKVWNCITITSIHLSLSLSHHQMGRPPCCDKLNVKRGLWTAEEDAKMLAHISNHGIGNWTLVPKKAGLNRCGKSCRLRWTNYLRPDLKHDSFTPQEEDLILDLHKAIGSRWSLIAKQLPGRTDNDVKNYWNTKLRKKLGKMGIDPVTHKSFSQILSDYGNIKGLSNTRTQMGPLRKTSNSTPMPISEPSSVPTQGLSNPKIVEGPIMEEFQDHILFNNNGSWEFQAQFQVINQEKMQPHFFNEVTSSSSSSSSSSNVNQLSSSQSFPCQPSPVQVAPSSPFSWSELLLGDPFLSTDLQQQERGDLQSIVSSTDSSILMQNKISQQKNIFNGNENIFNGVGVGVGQEDSITFDNGGTIGAATNKHSEASSSSVNSFVEAILDRDSKMCSEFPQLFDESFEY